MKFIIQIEFRIRNKSTIIIIKLIKEKYSIANNVYIKNKQFLGNKYGIIFKKITSRMDCIFTITMNYKKFREKYSEIFNEQSIFEKSDRTVLSRITDKAILIDRGVYTHPDNVKKISSELLEKNQIYD